MKMILSTADVSTPFVVLPDSAMGRNKQPWFIPDFGNNWRGGLALALRVGRLGKNISAKFVERYVDAVTLVWHPMADDVAPSVLQSMDSAVVVGQWVESLDCLMIDGETDVTLTLHAAMSLLADASKYMTLKTGDIVAVELPAIPSLTLIQSHIEHTLDNNTVLSFNIK